VFYKSLVRKRAVLFATPQTVLHDLEKGRLPREAIIDLVVDEAHHATRGDPYALVYAHLRAHGVVPRVLAVTASPGETEARIVEVCTNLGIRPSDMIIKTRDDPDVEAFVFHLDVKRYAMDLTPEYEAVRGRLVALLREPCEWLQSSGLVRGHGGKKAGEDTGSGSLALPSWDKLRLLADKHIAKSAARGIKEGATGPELEPDLDPRLVNDEPAIARSGARPELVSNLVLALRARHCVELVETQGFPALLAYHEKLLAKVAEKPTESLLALMTHPQYKASLEIAGKLVRDGSPRATKLNRMMPLDHGVFYSILVHQPHGSIEDADSSYNFLDEPAHAFLKSIHIYDGHPPGSRPDLELAKRDHVLQFCSNRLVDKGTIHFRINVHLQHEHGYRFRGINGLQVTSQVLDICRW
ncbi:MAG: hypothetical protein Q6370_015535, partial [Candidatus Sigynarchaeota archaeon]